MCPLQLMCRETPVRKACCREVADLLALWHPFHRGPAGQHPGLSPAGLALCMQLIASSLLKGQCSLLCLRATIP